MDNKPRWFLSSLKTKMFTYTFIIIFLMMVVSIYSLSITNIYKQRIDAMFERNLTLKDIGDQLTVVDQYLVSYLSTKDSNSLNDYMFHEASLLAAADLLVEDNLGYSEEELLVKDIYNMVNAYIEVANKAISDRRKSNVIAYTSYYREAFTTKGYIKSYIDELNYRQLGRNAENYLYMTKQVTQSNILNIVLIIDLVFLSIIIVLRMTKNMVNPIIRLSHAATTIAEGDFQSKPINVNTNDEVEILANAFNRMKSSIFDYIEALKENAMTEAALKDQQMENLKMQALLNNARLYALQSQMNPHFLFNTINAGVQLSLLEGAEKTGEFLETMSRLFRYNIKQFEAGVPLYKEVDNIRDYYELIKVRFGDLITFRVTMDQGCENFMIPPLTLQPFVENAYIHGLSKKEEGGHIEVSIILGMDDLLVVIEDNGVGISDTFIENLYHQDRQTDSKDGPTNGVGIMNVIERLELFYFEKGLVHISGQMGVGTRIELHLPYVQGGQ